MKVDLIAYTQFKDRKKQEQYPDPIRIVEECATVCYDSQPTESCRIAKGCMKSGHTSVFEHAQFVFFVTGVSRSLLAQLTRHRHASYSVRSQRYCDESGFEIIYPPYMSQSERDTFNVAMQCAGKSYYELIDKGAAKENARAVLPNACGTTLIISCNSRALITMSHERLCTRAQKEIRDLFKAMKAEVEVVSPTIAGYMVPKCEANAPYSFCTEHECCGRHPTLKEIYQTYLENKTKDYKEN